MTDELRTAFDDLLVGEPPLRTSAHDALAHGRRLRSRQRAVWTSAGTALAVVAVAFVPQVINTGTPADPAALQTSTEPSSIEPSPSAPGPIGPSPTPPAADFLQVNPFRVCPSAAPTDFPNDGSMLPDPERAAAAVLAAAPRIAPGLTFITRAAAGFGQQPKFEGKPWVALIFDVGDDAGYGAINLQIRPEIIADPSDRALRGANVSSCVDGWRHDFADGSVAIHYPYLSAQGEATVTHVWYFAAGGYSMNIGMFPGGWSASENPETPPPPPPLPVRGSMPLTINQLMAVADVVAHS
jgi:hypothetical protein